MRFVVLAMLLGVVACRHDTTPQKEQCFDPSNPDCVNYDPCYGKNEVTANFGIFGYWPQYDTLFPIYDRGKGNLTFIAEQDNAEYEWIVGAETIRTQSFVRYFAGQYVVPGQAIDVTLNVFKTPNSECHPNDDGMDTYTRRFYVRKDGADYNILGKYKVWFTSTAQEPVPSDSVTIDIRLVTDFQGIPLGVIHIVRIEEDSTETLLVRGAHSNDVPLYGPASFGAISDIILVSEHNNALGITTLDPTDWSIEAEILTQKGKVAFTGRRL